MTLAACADIVRRGDPDRFLAAMAAPPAARAVLFPLYAFNVEVARAPWVTAEPLIAEMRLQWWRDALDEIAEGRPVRAHEVTVPLAGMLDAAGARALDGAVAARRRDIDPAPFAGDAALWAHLDATAGTLMWVAARALGAAPDAETTVRRIGQAGGLASWFRAVPELVARGRAPLPDPSAEGVAALAGQGLDRLGPAPPGARHACRPAATAGPILRRVRRDAGPRRGGSRRAVAVPSPAGASVANLCDNGFSRRARRAMARRRGPSGGMVDAGDSKSPAARLVGSSPTSGTSPPLALMRTAGPYAAMLRRALVLALICLSAPVRAAGPPPAITVAVAANFATTAAELVRAYRYETGQQVLVAEGSTGRLYSQIVAGAPFDLFLSADAERPARLLAEGRAAAVRTYAIGRLVVVSRADNAVGQVLRGGRVALADPGVAPYGVAAMQAIASLGLDPADLDLVYGDSVGQVAALFFTGNVDAAFIARAQLSGLEAGVSVTDMDGRHAPIRQDAALLSPEGAAFFDWLGVPAARAIIAAAGYGLPE